MEKSLLSYAFSTFCYDITCLVPTYLPPFTLDSCLPFLHFLHICSLLILCSCISSFWFVVFTHLLRLLYQIDRIIMALSKEWSGPCGCMENSKYACPDTESLDSSPELNGPSSLNTWDVLGQKVQIGRNSHLYLKQDLCNPNILQKAVKSEETHQRRN